MKTTWHYIRNSKEFIATEPHFYFEWTVNGGHTPFGYHGPLRGYEAKRTLAELDYEQVWTLTKQEPIKECMFGVQYSGHGSDFTPDKPECNLTMAQAQQQALEWELKSDTIGGQAQIVDEFGNTYNNR